MAPDPLRMYLVILRSALDELARAGELAGAAAVACVRTFDADPAFSDAFAAWRPRPGKVCLRARTASQWRQVLAEPHAMAGGAAIAIPPRRRSERGPLLERLQAMSSRLVAPPARADGSDLRRAVTYLLNPAATMSSGKTLAQVAHAAVIAADGGGVEDWVAAGCPGRVLAPPAEVFASITARADVVARVVDTGLTEVPPGTVTVVALGPARGDALPAPL
jgi:Peptidyl-tRNA hydrolase PTH2